MLMALLLLLLRLLAQVVRGGAGPAPPAAAAGVSLTVALEAGAAVVGMGQTARVVAVWQYAARKGGAAASGSSSALVAWPFVNG
eukprot:SAG31_NODE_36809_length_310_cov_0.715640_1_plen_83_part_01